MATNNRQQINQIYAANEMKNEQGKSPKPKEKQPCILQTAKPLTS